MKTGNDWKKLIDDLVAALGGQDNIEDAFNCATRFRAYVKDDKKVDKDALKKVSLVKGVNFSNGQWQVIFGAGTVNKVMDNYNKSLSSGPGNSTVSKVTKKKQPIWDQRQSFWSNIWNTFRFLIRSFGDIFIPLIPIFIAGGLSLALMSLINTTAGSGTEAAKFFDMIGGAILGSLPIFVGWTAMRKFGGTPAIGLAVGVVLVAPSLLNSWGAATPIQVGLSLGENLGDYFNSPDFMNSGLITVTSSGTFEVSSSIEGAADINAALQSFGLDTDISAVGLTAIAVDDGTFNSTQVIAIINNNGVDYAAYMQSITSTYTVIFANAAGGFFSISFIGYQAQVFSAILAVAFAFYVEKFMKAVSHESIAIVAVPVVTVVVSAYFALWVWGPFGQLISEGIASGFNTAYYSLNFPGFGLGGAIVGFFYPLLVITGLHQGFTAVEATLIAQTSAVYGESFTWITAVASTANVAVGASALGVAFVSVSKPKQAAAVSGAVSAEMGITEPAIFGTNLDLVYPLVAAMIGAAIGGYWVGMTNTVATTLGSASWLGLIQFNPVATSAYGQYLSDLGQTQFITGSIGNLASEAIALSITFVAAFMITIGFSNTKWGAKSNEAREVKHYTFKESISYKKRKEISALYAAANKAEESNDESSYIEHKKEVFGGYWENTKANSVTFASEIKRGAIETVDIANNSYKYISSKLLRKPIESKKETEKNETENKIKTDSKDTENKIKTENKKEVESKPTEKKEVEKKATDKKEVEKE